jgi:DNA-binding MarR family transcriptional regulator
MSKLIELNERSIDILLAIHKKGGKDVRISATELKQNKNYYFRVIKMEDMKLINVRRVIGEKSYYSLTEKGYKVLVKHKTNEAEECLKKIGIEI